MNEQLGRLVCWLLRNFPFAGNEASRRELSAILAIPLPETGRLQRLWWRLAKKEPVAKMNLPGLIQ